MMWIVTFKSGAQQRMDLDDSDASAMEKLIVKPGAILVSTCGPILRCDDVAGMAPDYDDEPDGGEHE